MTASAHTRSAAELIAPSDASESAQHGEIAPRQREDSRRAWRVWFVTIAIIGALYALLWNPYWVPGGDSELYIAAARSLALGQGYRFNGQSISISPPGWPLLLAGAMKVSPSFGFLKLLTIACMLGALAIWYWILLRLTQSTTMSAVLTLATAIIQHVYSLSFWMHSDALFLLISAAAMLLAFQINEGRPHAGARVVALVALCFAMTFVRWAGVLQWVLVAGILARGIDLRPRRIATSSAPKQWSALALTLVVTFGTFFIVREALYLSPEEAAAAKDAGATLDEQQTLAEAKTVDLMNNKPAGKITLAEEYMRRFRRSGKWFAWLLWPEMRFLGSAGIKGSAAMMLLSSVDTMMGWVIILLLLVTLANAIRTRDWIWLALAVYCAALCLNWPNPNARYLVPVAPLALWGVIRGVQILANRPRNAPDSPARPMCRLPRIAIASFIVSIFVCSGILYATDVTVAHSDNFYSVYEGRQYEGLIAASHYLNGYGFGDRELGVSEKYINLGRPRASKSGLRVAVMLTNRVVQIVPMNKADEPVVPKTINYTRKQRIHWYLYQQPISPWRLWHFRVPGWLQEAMTREPVGPESGGWVLYRNIDGRWVGVDVREVRGWPTRVPGM
jgi:hypothetical protein